MTTARIKKKDSRVHSCAPQAPIELLQDDSDTFIDKSRESLEDQRAYRWRMRWLSMRVVWMYFSIFAFIVMCEQDKPVVSAIGVSVEDLQKRHTSTLHFFAIAAIVMVSVFLLSMFGFATPKRSSRVRKVIENSPIGKGSYLTYHIHSILFVYYCSCFVAEYSIYSGKPWWRLVRTCYGFFPFCTSLGIALVILFFGLCWFNAKWQKELREHHRRKRDYFYTVIIVLYNHIYSIVLAVFDIALRPFWKEEMCTFSKSMIFMCSLPFGYLTYIHINYYFLTRKPLWPYPILDVVFLSSARKFAFISTIVAFLSSLLLITSEATRFIHLHHSI